MPFSCLESNTYDSAGYQCSLVHPSAGCTEYKKPTAWVGSWSAWITWCYASISIGTATAMARAIIGRLSRLAAAPASSAVL